jgi:4-amino-4-deoxy-L-arabinose transferase-like glycosyltransferase
MPTLLLQTILAGVLVVIAGLAMLSLFRGFRSYLRRTKGEPVVPLVDVNPPEPVVKTAAVELVAWVAILWAVANLALLVVCALTLQDRPMLSSVPVQLAVMIYALVATLVGGCGGVMLLKLLAYGRRMVAWGAALFGIMNVFGFAVCLFLRQYVDVSTDVQHLASAAAVVLVGHTLIDVAIGISAQHVGLAKGQGGPEGAASDQGR